MLRQAASEENSILTPVLLSAIFEHLPSQMLASHTEKSLSARCSLVSLKYPRLPKAEERGLRLTPNATSVRVPSTDPGPPVQPQGPCYRARALSRRPSSRPASCSLLFCERLMNADGVLRWGDAAVLLQGSARLAPLGSVCIFLQSRPR